MKIESKERSGFISFGLDKSTIYNNIEFNKLIAAAAAAAAAATTTTTLLSSSSTTTTV